MIPYSPASPAGRARRSPSSPVAALPAPARPRRWLQRACATLELLCGAFPVLAIDFDDVLPVDEALVVSATATSRDRIEIRWQIADGYYLYRHRTAAQVPAGDFGQGALRMPDGRRHTDEFFGEVETYRGELVAVLPGQAADGARSVALQVKYQGCADLGICYPPQTRTLQVALPATGTSTPTAPARDGDTGFASLGRTLGAGAGGIAPTLAGNGTALPPEQAFAFEAIAGDGNTILLRFTPARGYYLYRDRNSFRIDGADGIRAGAPRWPAGTAHYDEHFGAVTVYFDQVDVPLPLIRTQADAAEVTVTATFQGCQTDGICYPPMTRTVPVSLPAGRPQTVAEAAAALAGPASDASAPAPRRTTHRRPHRTAAMASTPEPRRSRRAPMIQPRAPRRTTTMRTAPVRRRRREVVGCSPRSASPCSAACC